MSEPTEPASDPVRDLVNEPTSDPMGFLPRVINIFFSPGQVFQNLREHPSFIPPIIVIVLLSMAVIPVYAPMNEKMAIEQMQQQNPDVHRKRRMKRGLQMGMRPLQRERNQRRPIIPRNKLPNRK